MLFIGFRKVCPDAGGRGRDDTSVCDCKISESLNIF